MLSLVAQLTMKFKKYLHIKILKVVCEVRAYVSKEQKWFFINRLEQYKYNFTGNLCFH